MKIGILGTGVVGRTLADGCTSKGHDVAIGTRDVEALMARTEPDAMGNPPFASWRREHEAVGVRTLKGAAEHGELLINATLGEASLAALDAAGAEALGSKIVIDTSNPIDSGSGFPFTLFVANTDSLGERLQVAFPDARFVKAFNTMTASVMCDPVSLADGDHTITLCGNHEEAKAEVTSLLESFGWRDIIDLGDLTGARAMEAALTVWIRLYGALGTPVFNSKVVR